MPFLPAPGQSDSQPQYVAPIDLSNPLNRGLAFAVNAFSGPVDSKTGKRAATWNKSKVGTRRGMSLSNTGAAAKTAEFDFNPIVGSNGNGTGGVTFAVLANPAAEARESCLIGVMMSGSPYKQIALYANMDGDLGSASSGMLSVESYNNANQGFGNAAGVIDGGWHVYVGVFNHGSHAVYVDGVNKTTASGISGGSPGDGTFGLDASSRISVGNESHNAATRAINCQIPFAAAWNRAFSAAEVVKLTEAIWATWEPLPLWLYFALGGGPTTYNQSIAGSLTAAGNIVKLTGKNTAGLTTFSGSIVKLTTKSYTGSMTAAGALAKLTTKAFAGSITGSGALGTMILFTASLAGSLTPAGALSKLTMKALAGSSTLAGAITKKTFRTLDGNISMVGVVTKLTKKAFAGSVTVTGALSESYQVLKSLAGSITPTGALAAVYIAFVAGVLKLLALMGVGQ